jgi:ribosomal protein S27AE
MPIFEMKIFNPRRDQRPYVVPDFEGPVVIGVGDATYRCGRCASELLKNVEWTRVRDIAIQCGKCGKVNAVPDAPTPLP